MRIHPKRIAFVLILSTLLCSAIYFTSGGEMFHRDTLHIHDNHPAKSRIKISISTDMATGKHFGNLFIKKIEQPTMKGPAVDKRNTKKGDKVVITTKKSKIDKYLERMHNLHQTAHNIFSKEELFDFYSKERISEEKFRNVLDIDKDWKLLSTLFPSPNEENDRVTDQLRLKLKITKPKKILIWSGDQTNNREKLLKDNCNIKECTVTRDKRLLSHADTVFFAGSAALKRNNKNKNQTWVSFQIESAQNYPTLSTTSTLNWTASYRRDSVLNTPYEKFVPYLNVTNLPDKPLKNYAQGKNKLVAWFVSNCGGHNQRKNYVDELKKYITVDMYGGCGSLSCVRTDKGCFQMLKRDYKFYLAFENSNCKDYVTEKLHWNAYLNNIVPIVMGAHPNDYKKLAPPKSYIHVDYFKSPAELAEYLKFLDKHDDLYNSYFLWKGTGEFINTKFMCRLCAMTHLAPHFPMWYDNANKWWKENDICVGRHNGFNYATWKGKQEGKSFVNHVRYGYKRES